MYKKALAVLVCSLLGWQFYKIRSLNQEIFKLKQGAAVTQKVGLAQRAPSSAPNTPKIPLPAIEDFRAHLESSLADGKSMSEILDLFARWDGSDPEFLKYFPVVAEWSHLKLPHDKLNSDWFGFAFAWLTHAPDAADEFLAKMDDRDLLKRDFARAKTFHQINRNYKPFLKRAFIEGDFKDFEEFNRINSHLIRVAYQQMGPALLGELRAEYAEAKKHNQRYGSTIPFYNVYALMWEKNPSEAMDLTAKAILDPNIVEAEKDTARDLAYSTARDEFLEWFKDAAPSLATSEDVDELLLWYRMRVSDSDQKWLLEHKNFRPFHELALQRVTKESGSYTTPDVAVAVDER